MIKDMGVTYALLSAQKRVHNNLSNVKNKLSVRHFIVILNNNKSVNNIKLKIFKGLSIYIVLVKQICIIKSIGKKRKW